MRILILGASMLALATATAAQVPVVPETVVPVPTATDIAAQKAAADRAADAEKAAVKDREAAEERMNDQAKKAEKDREAAEKSAKAQEKAAAEQQANAEKAAADRAAAEKASAEKAAAAPAVAAAPQGDARDVVTQVCLADAKDRAMALGARNVTMNKVEDTDKKSDGRASVRAKVNVVTVDAKGKMKVQKKTIKCDTRNGVVTAFKWS